MTTKELLQAWRRDRDFKRFQEILDRGCDVNKVYLEESLPILGVLSCENVDEVEKYAAAVLAKNAEKNARYDSGKCAIHHAAEVGNVGVIKALIDGNADVNIMDQGGSTAMHFLVQGEWNTSKQKCMALLLSHDDIDVNIIDQSGSTPIMEALFREKKEAVMYMLDKDREMRANPKNKGKRNLIDFDFKRNDVSTRENIMEKYPDLKEMIPEYSSSHSRKVTESELMDLLTTDAKKFCSVFLECQTTKTLLEWHDGQHTLLQIACQKNLEEAVKLILEKGGDPNFTRGVETAIHTAARLGQVKILKMLLENAQNRMVHQPLTNSPLHNAVHYAMNSPEHVECLKMLIDKRWDNGDKFDINAVDKFQKTPLHYAVLYSDDASTEVLLKKGAYIGVEHKGISPLDRMNPKVLENALDQLMTHTPTHKNGYEQFKFDFFILKPPPSIKANPVLLEQENKPLLRLSRTPDLHHLITHPVLTSFTFLKWQQIRRFYFMNLAVYCIFCFLLTSYIISGYHLDQSINDYKTPIYFIQILVITFTLILFIREFFQFVFNWKKYVQNFENYLELTVIILSLYICFTNCHGQITESDDSYCPHINAVAILTSWIGLLLLIGKYPKFSVQVQMFRTVLLSFIRFLSWYTLLITAFALSFYVLFRRCQNCENNPFTNEFSALFKTLVMLTGEFDLDDDLLKTSLGTSHIIFIIFVFLIAIVLLNLLNGLAVADTKTIKDKAYFYSCCARVELISFFEEFLYNVLSYKNSDRFIWRIIQRTAKRLSLFDKFLLEDSKIIVHPLEGNRVEVNNKDTGRHLDDRTMSTAKALVVSKGEKLSLLATNNKIEQLSVSLLELKSMVENMAKQSTAKKETNT